MNLFNRFFKKPPVVLKVFKHVKTAIMPRKNHSTGVFTDAAYDLYALNDTLIQGRGLVSTGLSIIIPAGYWVKFHERSGLASKKGIHVLGGVIDNTYSGEWKVILYCGEGMSTVVEAGQAICQFTVEKMTESSTIEITSGDFYLEEFYRDRKSKGFGSSDETTKK